MSRSITEIRNGRQHGPVTSFVSQHNVAQLNPFVLWDHFQAEGLEGTTGFGFHGHSGVATISYPVVGDIIHEDTDGNQGKLEAGGVQLMASGAGVLHKETVYPHQGDTDAFQLWTLLPQDGFEMGPVTYSLAQKEAVPVVATSDSETKVLVGKHADAVSPARHCVDITYLEIRLNPEATWAHAVAKGQSSGFIYVRSGEVSLNNRSLRARQLGVLNQSDADFSLTAGNAGAVIMVALGQPLQQPIISSGPSIHSSRERLAKGTGNIQRLTTSLRETSRKAV
ncbi:pirin family protein [Marinobacterium jannaschii]|uniref:pirin family protein n=1 Tax=Marinobacterium jannaschii TaxID=64970 RepID=UPI00048687F0|nr:pirin family protein [Marinobacterium jannaschii]